MEKAVAAINAMTPPPRFVIVCGDLIHAFPKQAALAAQQVADFKNIMGKVHSNIPLVSPLPPPHTQLRR